MTKYPHRANLSGDTGRRPWSSSQSGIVDSRAFARHSRGTGEGVATLTPNPEVHAP